MRGFLVGIEETDRRWEAGYVSAFQQILDRHQYTEIEQTINFLYTSDDDQAFFWRPKVKSADYLNRKFEQIHQAKDASILKRKADARAEAEMQKSYVERGGRPSGSHHDDGLVGRRILDRL
jgi:hypothetical protein